MSDLVERLRVEGTPTCDCLLFLRFEAAAEISRLRRELEGMREIAANPLAIQKVRDEFGPLSLWSRSSFEAEVKRRIDAALAPDVTEIVIDSPQEPL